VSRSLRELDLEPLSVEEFMRRCRLPIAADTIESTAELVAWFVRKYPTVQARFAYVRSVRARVLRG
jgi:hypothetical protein